MKEEVKTKAMRGEGDVTEPLLATLEKNEMRVRVVSSEGRQETDGGDEELLHPLHRIASQNDGDSDSPSTAHTDTPSSMRTDDTDTATTHHHHHRHHLHHIDASKVAGMPTSRRLRKRNSILRLYDEDAASVTRLIGEGFELRREIEENRASNIPDLESSFPVLSLLLKFCGLLRSREGIFRNPLPWSALMTFVCILPYILSSILPRCPMDCRFIQNSFGKTCGMCTATLSDSAVNGYHTVAFSMLALFLSRKMAWTLYETTTACKVKHEIDKVRLRYTLGCFVISFIWWALVPLIGLSFPGFVSIGDVIVGLSALVRAPFAATLSAAVLGSLTLIMATLSLEMKGIRAASKVGLGPGGGSSGDMLQKQLRYTATLHAAYHHANLITQQAAVNIQFNILAFFALAINSSLACLFVCFMGEWDENPDYATVLMIGNTVAINVFALVLCGFAAHITSITDSTIRSVQNQFMISIAAALSRESEQDTGNGSDDDDGKSKGKAATKMFEKRQRKAEEESTTLQQIGILSDLLSYAREAGGFRILGQRISYSFFLICFTALVGVTNLFVSRMKKI